RTSLSDNSENSNKLALLQSCSGLPLSGAGAITPATPSAVTASAATTARTTPTTTARNTSSSNNQCGDYSANNTNNNSAQHRASARNTSSSNSQCGYYSARNTSNNSAQHQQQQQTVRLQQQQQAPPTPVATSAMDKFIRLADAVTEFEADYNDTAQTDHTKYTLAIQQEELKTLWKKAKAAYEELVNSDTLDAKAVSAVKPKYKSSYAVYLRCMSNMADLHAKLVKSEKDIE
ncbi:type-2 histone deacetylase 1-like, partial [Rhagoletis pomonella]|uniref:type-2 histone deacetylase 1-like n=1 Tax=Rhagoletis pomonella TaxID=28610 RepID=UPI00177E4968